MYRIKGDMINIFRRRRECYKQPHQDPLLLQEPIYQKARGSETTIYRQPPIGKPIPSANQTSNLPQSSLEWKEYS